MARQVINLGVIPNGVGGDSPRTANTKINDMTLELYAKNATLGTASTRNVQASTMAVSGEVLVAGFNGIGVYADLRATVYSTGNPTDLLETGTVYGFADGGELGIPGLVTGAQSAFGVLHSHCQWRNTVAGAGLNQSFDSLGGTWKRYPASPVAWTSWERVSGPIVGSAAAGAVMERGSTSSGEFTKFADGLLVCQTSSTPAPTMLNASNIGTTWTFPAAFIAIPSVTANLRTTTLAGRLITGPHAVNVSVGSSSLYMFSAAAFVAADATGVIFSATAVGRWK